MDEEPDPKPTAKFPSFLIIILGLLLLLVILIFLFFFFRTSPTGFLTGNIIASNTSTSRCEIYATQFGLSSPSDCKETDNEKCLALCTAHFECC